MKISIIMEALTGMFETDIKRASKTTEKASLAMQRDLKKMGAAAGIYLAAASAAMAKLVSDSINTADAMRDMSIQFGVSVPVLSSYSLAATQAGTSVETLGRGLKVLSKQAVDNSAALEAMGISARTTDGSMKGLDALLGEISDKFKGYRDGPEKAALAMQLFGKSGAELIPLLNEGAEGLEAMRERADALGVTISTELANASDQFNDNLGELRALATGFANDLATALLPSMNALAEQMVEGGIEARKNADSQNVFADAIKVVVSAGIVAKNTLESLFDVLFAGADIFGAVGDSAVAFGQQLGTVASAQWEFMKGNFAASSKILVDGMAEAEGAHNAALARMSGAWEAFGSGVDVNAEDVRLALAAIWAPTAKAADEVDKLGDAANKAAPPVVKLGNSLEKAAKDAAAAQEKLARENVRAAESFAKYKAKVEDAVRAVVGALTPLEALEAQYRKDAQAVGDAIALRIAEGETYEDLIAILLRVKAARDQDADAIAEQMNPAGKIIKDMRAEIDLMRMGNIERERETILRQANAVATDEQAAEIDALLLAMAREQKIEAFAQSAADAFGEFATSAIFDADNIGDAFENLGDELLGMIKNTVSEMISEFAKTKIIKPMLEGLFNSAMAIPIVGWIVAGAMANDSLFAQGWKPGGGTLGLPDGREIRGGSNFAGFGNFTGAPSLILDRTLQGLGLSERISSLISGTAVHTRLFGRKAPELEYANSFGSIGAGGVGGRDAFGIVREGGVFRSDRRWEESGALNSELRDALQSIFESAKEVAEDAADALGMRMGDLIGGAFTIKRDKEGEIIEQFSTVLGRIYNESIEEFATRINAEQIIAQIDNMFANPVRAKVAIADDVERGGGGGGTVRQEIEDASAIAGEASAIAERWRDDAQTLAEGAGFLLLAAVDMNNGFGLLGEGGTLTEITDLVEELQHNGENLVDAYTRIVDSTSLYSDALALAGVKLAMAREEFVRFAVEIADAAGGLERAQQLWQTYFATFYTAEERIALSVTQAQEAAANALGDLGLDPAVSLAEFRDQFEAAMPNLTPEQIAQWLEAGEAIARLAAAEADLTAERQIAIDAIAEQVAASAELADLLAGLVSGPSTQFGQDVADIRERWQELSDQANELAIASGRAGASTEELAQITQWAANQFAMATDRLKGRVQSLAEQLYGTELTRIESQIESISTANDAAQQAADAAGEANARRYEQELAYIEQIRRFVESLKLSALSPLNPSQQFSEANAQFEQLIAAARGGDVDALAQVQASAQTLLGQGQSFLGPSDQYTALFDSVMASLSSLGVTGSPGGPSVTLVPSDELNELFARREALLLEQEERNRASLAEQLAIQLGELSLAMRQSVVELAAEMGISLTDLVTDLGINLEQLSATTGRELSDVASVLNLSVADLAAAVGVSLGEISDANSLLNDAFEEEMADLPQGIQSELTPLLRAVEDAVSEADANAALAVLRAAVDELAPALRDELAPFVSLPSTISEPITSMAEQLAGLAEQQITLLGEIRNGINFLAFQIPPPATVTPEGVAVQPLATAAQGTPERAASDVNRLLEELIAVVKSGGRESALAIQSGVAKAQRGRGW